MIRFFQPLADSWDARRRRMIRETEHFLNKNLKIKNPIVIPTVKFGVGKFPRSLTRLFWNKILGL